MTTAGQACIDAISDPFKDYSKVQMGSETFYVDAQGRRVSASKLQQLEAKKEEAARQCAGGAGQLAFGLGNAGYLAWEFAERFQARNVEADGYTNRPVMTFPKPSLNILRGYEGNPGLTRFGGWVEVFRGGYGGVMGLADAFNPPVFYSQELGDLPSFMAGDVTGPLDRRWWGVQALGSPLLTDDSPDPSAQILRRAYAVPSFLRLTTGMAEMQATTNKILDVPVCDESNVLGCEALAERDTSGNATDLFQGTTEEESEYHKSEISSAISALQYTGQGIRWAGLAGNSEIFFQSLESQGRPSWASLSGLAILPLQYAVANGANKNAFEGAQIVSPENFALSSAALGLGFGASWLTDDPRMLKLYDSHFSMLGTGYFSPRASALIHGVALDEGNAELSGMLKTGLPLMNGAFFTTGGTRYGMALRDWQAHTTAEKVSLGVLPAAVAGVHAISTAQAAKESGEEAVWGNFGLDMAAYSLGIGLGALIGNKGFGRFIDGVSVGPGGVKIEGRF